MRRDGGSGRGQVGRWWPLAAIALCGTVYLWEILTLTGVPVARDMQMFFVPQKHILWEALQAGRIPLWTPLIGNGSPFLANVQSGVFYPPHWLFALLPFYAAFNLLVVFHFLLGGGFAFLLGRRLGLGPVPAFVAASTWMFGGYFASLLNLVNALQGAAWAPGLAWAALRWLDEGGHRALALVIVVSVMSILAGEPQSFLLAAFATLVLGATRLARRRPGPGELGELAAGAVAAAVVVSGLVMIQVLPTLELLAESSREGGLSYGEAAAFDLVPIRLIHLLVPTDYSDPEYVFGVRSVIGRGDPWLFSVYLGAFAPLLLWLALGSPRRRPEAVAWSVIAAFALVVALGGHTPVFPWLFEHVPGFGAFRFPEKYFFMVAFAVMLLSGWGAEALLEGEPRRRDGIFGAAYFGAALAAWVSFRAGKEPIRDYAARFGNDRMMEDFDFAFGVWSQNIGKLALLVGLLLILWWLFRTGRLSRAYFVPLVALLVVADLMVAHRDLNPVVEREFYETEPLIFDHVPLDEVRRDYRLRVSRFDSIAGTVPVVRGVPLEAQKWLWQQLAAPNVGQTWDVLTQDAWDAIKLRRIRDELDLQRVIPDWERRWALLRLQSVRYVHAILDIDPVGLAREVPLDTLPGRLYELLDPIPRAYVVPESRRLPDRDSVINAILAPEFDARRTVVIEDPTRAGAPATDVDGAGRASNEVPTTAEPGADTAAQGANTAAQGADAAAQGVSIPATVTTRTSAAATDAAPTFPGATIVEAAGELVRVRLDAGVSGHLVLTDNHYPGWTAEVDGESRPIELGNFFFRAVAIEPGDREVVFAYRSAPFERGRLVSLITLVAFGLVVVTLEVRGRHGRAA